MSFQHRHSLEQRLLSRDGRRGENHLTVLRRTTAVSVLAHRGEAEAVAAALGPLCSLYSVGPGEWIATDAETASADLARTLNAAAEGRAAIVDQGEGRTALRLEGPNARQILAKLTAVDTAPEAFPLGHATQTGLAEVSVTLARTGDTSFDLLPMSTFAVWVFDELMEMGREYGLTSGFAG